MVPNPVHIVDGWVNTTRVNLTPSQIEQTFELFSDSSNYTPSVATLAPPGKYRDSFESKTRNDFTTSMYMKVDEFALTSLLAWKSDVYAGVSREQLMMYNVGAGSRLHVDDQNDDVPQLVGTTKYLMHVLNQVACLLYVSTDDIEGGEFVFAKQNITVPPLTGTLVCFPSNYLYPHEVMPVIAGKRIAFARHYYVRDLPSV